VCAGVASVETKVAETVSATGGSARSQLYDLRERTWKPVTLAPAVAHAPVARNDTTGTLLNKNVLIDVLANDTDVDGNIDPTSLTITSLPASGAKQITATNGQIHVEVAALYCGTLTFNYEICDTTNPCSQAVVVVTFLAAI
jgi:hypothetical protein